MTAGKTIALTRWTFVVKVMSLLFHMLFNIWSRVVSSKEQASLNFMSSAVILEPQKIKSVIVSPSICHAVMGPDAMILVL